MRSYTLDVSPVEIRVNEHTFHLQKSDGEAYQMVCSYMDYIRTCGKDADCIRRFIARGCELADELLGAGACFKIFGSNPISLGHIVSLCAQIAGGCLRSYRRYLKKEYLEVDDA